MKKEILDCACHSTEHIYIAVFDEDDKIVYIEPHLSTGGFFYRLKASIKYLFGYKSKFGDFDEFCIDETNYKQFKKIVDFFENN